jgi:hypothetical protein
MTRAIQKISFSVLLNNMRFVRAYVPAYDWKTSEIMDAAQILGYTDSPNFLTAEENFPHTQELAHVLRKAKIACGLKGVYVLIQTAGDIASFL